MVVHALMLVLCLGSVLSDKTQPPQYKYHPYKQHPVSSYYNHYQHLQQNNRRHFQRSYTFPRASSSHLSSPSLRYKPRPGRTIRHLRPAKYRYDRAPHPQHSVLRRPPQVPASNERATRKIEQTPLLLGKAQTGRKEGDKRKKYSPYGGNKHKNFLIQKDNLAVESQVVETKVKVPPQLSLPSAHKPKPQPVKSSQNSVKPAVAANRNYKNVPQGPKFIIKQAGPSQQFGWVGHHGHHAPLNIPNIFRAAGLNTRWTPGQDPVFQVGLLYPPASSHSAPAYQPPAPSYSGPASVKVKKSIPHTEYSKAASAVLPARTPPYTGSPVAPPAPPPPPSTTPATTTTTTTATTSTTTRAASSHYRSPTPTSYHYQSDYVQPSTYKPTFVSSTGKPFSVFIGSTQQTTVKPRPTFRPNNKDEEVFYIFYENDDKPLEPIRTGVDLQKYIEKEIENVKEDLDLTSQDVRKRKTPRPQVRNQNKPLLIDVPIKIEENGEGFTPPSKIRKVFVPHDNSESIPEVFDVSVGTSWGYKPRNQLSSFPYSSYNNPVTSYDAPVVSPDTPELSKPVKKVKRVKKERLTDAEQLSSLPFGTRLGAKESYDIIKK